MCHNIFKVHFYWKIVNTFLETKYDDGHDFRINKNEREMRISMGFPSSAMCRPVCEIQ